MNVENDHTGVSFRLQSIGREVQRLVTLERLVSDPDELRGVAVATKFVTADHHYPGIRAPLPSSYLEEVSPIVANAAREVCGRSGPVHVIDASFSIVTSSPADLTVAQRLPHCDAFTRGRVAMIHYLSLGASDGTAFFRHRSTGFETVGQARAPIYFDQLDAELRYSGGPPAGYIRESNPLFERIALAEAGYNRAYLYPSWSLHSGAISPDASLSPDPAIGRLTVTAFLSVD